MARVASWAGAYLVLGVLLLLAVQGTLFAVAAIVIAVLLIAVVMLGPTRLGERFLVVAMFFGPIFSKQFTLGPITPSDILMVLGFGLLFPRLLNRRIRVPSDFILGLLVFLVLAIVASALQPHLALALYRLVKMFFAILVMPLAFLAWRPPQKMINVLAWAYIGGQTLSTLYPFAFGGATISRLYGLTTQPNAFAICCILALGLLFYLYPQVSGRARVAVWGFGALQFAALIMSGSRGAIVALAVLLLVVPIRERSGKIFYALAVTGVVLVTTAPLILAKLGPESAPNRLLHPEASTTASGSDAVRGQFLDMGFQAFFHHPILGEGFGGYYTFYYHDIYLETAAAAGAFGLVAFLVVVWSVIRPLFGNSSLYRLGYCALGYFLCEIFVPTIWDRFAWMVLSLVLLAHSYPPRVQAEEGSEPMDQRVTPLVAVR